MPLLCTVECSQANWSVATIKIESYHIAIGTMAYQVWGIIKATDLAEHNRTWNTTYKYVSNGTGQESTSMCVCGGVMKSFECNYFYSWMLIFQAGLEAQRHLYQGRHWQTWVEKMVIEHFSRFSLTGYGKLPIIVQDRDNHTTAHSSSRACEST